MMSSFKLNREETVKHLNETGHSALIVGPVGVGKTTIVRQPRMVSAQTLAMEFALHGMDAITKHVNSQIHYQAMTVVIDDLGMEDDVKHYGNQVDPVQYVIHRVYDINQTAAQKIRLLLTTNLDKTSLQEKYGERTMSRIYEMCDVIVLADTNLRDVDK